LSEALPFTPYCDGDCGGYFVGSLFVASEEIVLLFLLFLLFLLVLLLVVVVVVIVLRIYVFYVYM
jgi:hypothetical protein